MEKFPILNALCQGVKMIDLAKEMDAKAPYLSIKLAAEMKEVAEHPINQNNEALASVLSVRNAFAVRRNPRQWQQAMANTLESNDSQSLGSVSLLAAPSLEQAYELVLKTSFITKEAAVAIINETLRTSYKIQKI